VALQIFEPFLKRYGLKLQVFYGTANALVERVIAEAAKSQILPFARNPWRRTKIKSLRFSAGK
jgi:hypothetical protein